MDPILGHRSAAHRGPCVSRGLGDTMGLFFTAAALAVSADGAALGIRLFLPLVFLWITSPVSSHFLSQIEYFTQKNLFRHMDRR